MKELYFTSENIEFKTDAFLETIREIHTIKKIDINLNNSALLVLDMQKYFFQPSSHAYIPSAPAVIAPIKKLIELYKQKSKPVIYTRHVNTPEDAKNMNIWWKNLILEQQQESEIIEDILITNPVVIKKTQYDAFYQTELLPCLNRQKITDIVITGVMTHLCVETTARSAFMRGFKVIITADGTATYNSTYHLSSLINLSHGFATVLKTSECVERLKKFNG
ncbi:MAG: isochorismatase family protein [bacterium]